MRKKFSHSISLKNHHFYLYLKSCCWSISINILFSLTMFSVQDIIIKFHRIDIGGKKTLKKFFTWFMSKHKSMRWGKLLWKCVECTCCLIELTSSFFFFFMSCWNVKLSSYEHHHHHHRHLFNSFLGMMRDVSDNNCELFTFLSASQFLSALLRDLNTDF